MKKTDLFSVGGEAYPIRLDWIALVVLAVFWICQTLIINPVGDFPLNDDWAFGKVTKGFLETGRFRPHDFQAMTLFAQTLWGSLFCIPFGFSFTALRVSTLSLGLVGLFSTYLLLKECKCSTSHAFLGALLIATNPLYVQLSHTFMTDVPFTAFSLLSVWLLLRYIQRDETLSLWLGILCGCAAILTRQIGLFIPIAFAVGCLTSRGFRLRTLFLVVVVFTCMGGVYWIFQGWMRHVTGVPAGFNAPAASLFQKFEPGIIDGLHVIVHGGMVATFYLGLFLFPLLGIWVLRHFQSCGSWWKWAHALLLLAYCGVALRMLIPRQKLMPLVGNILYDTGLGPVLLRDTRLLHLPHLPSYSRTFWEAVTIVAVIGGALLCVLLVYRLSSVTLMCRKEHQSRDSASFLFLLVGACAYYLPVGLTNTYDRYFLPLVPLLSSLVLGNFGWCNMKPTRGSLLCALVLILVIAQFSARATLDYLAMNRSRWQALESLTDVHGIPPRLIDGGFEFNGWHQYSVDYQRHEDKSWWWVHDDTYLITLGSVQGYETLATYRFRRFLPFGHGSIHILRRAEENR